MRKVLMFFAPIVFLTFASSALADGVVDFTASSMFAPSGPSFTITFSTPSTFNSSMTVYTPVDLSVGGSSIVDPGGSVMFFPLANLGLFDVYLSHGGNSLVYEFFGAQSYTGTTAPFSLLTGTFPVTGGDVIVNSTLIADLSGGTVTAKTATTATPEPSTLALLGCGLFAIVVLYGRKCIA